MMSVFVVWADDDDCPEPTGIYSQQERDSQEVHHVSTLSEPDCPGDYL